MTETTEPRWIFHSPDSGTEMSVDHPVHSGEHPDAEDIRPATKANLAAELNDAWVAWADDRAELERLRIIVAAARNVAETLNGGFLVCSRCGDQESTTRLDYARDLYAALGMEMSKR